MVRNILEKFNRLLSTGFFHVFGSGVINKVIGFLSSIVLVRILSKPEYGTFTYAWNIFCLVLLFNGMGIESGVLQLSSERGGDTKYLNKYSCYGTKFGLKFDMLLTLTLLGIGLFAPLKVENGRSLICALCLLPTTNFIYSMMSIYLRSQKRNQEYAVFSVLNTSMVFIASAVFAFLFREMGMVIGQYLASITTILFGAIVFKIRLVNRNAEDIGEDKKIILKIAFITMVNNGLSQLLFLLDIFVLGIVDPQETILASYKVATMIPTALTFIPTTLIIYLYPYFAQNKDDGKWCLNNYKKVVSLLGGLNLFISAILFFAAPLIIRLLFGIQYLDSVPVFKLLAINYFFSGTFRILSGNLLVTQRKLNFNLFVAIVSSLINIVADYCFIQWWGSIGAALATILVVLVSSVLSTTYLVFTFKRKTNELEYE